MSFLRREKVTLICLSPLDRKTIQGTFAMRHTSCPPTNSFELLFSQRSLWLFYFFLKESEEKVKYKTKGPFVPYSV